MNTIFTKLWPELKQHLGRLSAALIFGAAISGLKALTPELSRKLIDDAWLKNNHTLAWQIPVTIALTWSVAAALRYFHMFWMKYVADLIAIKLRRDLMNKYLSLNIGYLQNFAKGSGGLISRMVNDINNVHTGVQRLAEIMREPFMVIFAFGYLVYIDWRLTFFIIVAMPLITGILRQLARSLRKYGRKNQELMEDLTKTLKESLDGARVVQSFNLEDEMRGRFNEQADQFLETRKKIISREEFAGPISEIMASMTLAMILVFIGNQIFAGRLTVADFMGFSFAIGFLQDSVKKVQDSYIKVQQASVALERLHQILEADQPLKDHTHPVAFPEDWQTIEFRNVSFSFEKEPVLRGINLTVRRGELLAIVGSSGAGKTTLVNLLERFFDPNEGEILIGGVNIKHIRLKDLRRHISLVTQDVFLFGESIMRNIQLGNLERSADDIIPAAQAANAHNFILKAEGGYENRAGDHGSRLSGGEKQRISIARALFKDAPILILDEATSALDSESELEVQKGIDQLIKGRTTFVIAHRLSTIMKADRILVFKKGQIVEEGSHEQLMRKQGEYFQFRMLQS